MEASTEGSQNGILEEDDLGQNETLEEDDYLEEPDRNCYDHFATNLVETAKWAIAQPSLLKVGNQEENLKQALTSPRQTNVDLIHSRLWNFEREKERVQNLLEFFDRIARSMRYLGYIINQYGRGMSFEGPNEAIQFIFMLDLAVPAFEDFMRIFTEYGDVTSKPVFNH